MKLRTKHPDEWDERGTHMAIPWDLFLVNSSVFVPTLTPRKAAAHFRRVGKRKGMGLRAEVGSERGVYGVRLYRET